MTEADKHMDDLFRKAAEHYPLLTDNADWRTVKERLFDDSIALKEVAGANDRGQFHKAGLLVLFLLIPLVVTVTQFLTIGGSGVAIRQKGVKTSISQATASNEQVNINSIFNSENQEKIKAMQAMFFNEQLQLTPEEAKKFWPLYTEYRDEIKKVNQQMRNLESDNSSPDQKLAKKNQLEEQTLSLSKTKITAIL